MEIIKVVYYLLVVFLVSFAFGSYMYLHEGGKKLKRLKELSASNEKFFVLFSRLIETNSLTLYPETDIDVQIVRRELISVKLDMLEVYDVVDGFSIEDKNRLINFYGLLEDQNLPDEAIKYFLNMNKDDNAC